MSELSLPAINSAWIFENVYIVHFWPGLLTNESYVQMFNIKAICIWKNELVLFHFNQLKQARLFTMWGSLNIVHMQSLQSRKILYLYNCIINAFTKNMQKLKLCNHGWREGSMVKSTWYFCRGLGVSSYHLYVSSEHLLPPAVKVELYFMSSSVTKNVLGALTSMKTKYS